MEYWHAIFVHFLSERIHPESHKQWQLNYPTETDLLSREQLSKFPDTQSRALKVGGCKQSSQVDPPRNAQRSEQRIQSYAVSSQSCEDCSEDPKLNTCPKFKALSDANRHHIIKGKKLCFNCFHPDHCSKDFQSKFSCRKCKMNHHALLELKDHQRTQGPPNPPRSVITGETLFKRAVVRRLRMTRTLKSASHKDSNSKFTTGHLNNNNQNNGVPLSTVVVSIRNASGKPIEMRSLLESWSQASFITAIKSKALMLSPRSSQATITILGSTQTHKTCWIWSTTINDAVDVNLHLISKLTNVIPSSRLISHKWGTSTIWI